MAQNRRMNEKADRKLPLRQGARLTLRMGLERLNKKYAKTLEMLAR